MIGATLRLGIEVDLRFEVDALQDLNQQYPSYKVGRSLADWGSLGKVISTDAERLIQPCLVGVLLRCCSAAIAIEAHELLVFTAYNRWKAKALSSFP